MPGKKNQSVTKHSAEIVHTNLVAFHFLSLCLCALCVICFYASKCLISISSRLKSSCDSKLFLKLEKKNELKLSLFIQSKPLEWGENTHIQMVLILQNYKHWQYSGNINPSECDPAEGTLSKNDCPPPKSPTGLHSDFALKKVQRVEIKLKNECLITLNWNAYCLCNMRIIRLKLCHKVAMVAENWSSRKKTY